MSGRKVLLPPAVTLAALGAIVGCSGDDAPHRVLAPDTETNVLLLVIDTLRADHLSCYGGLVRTPHLDRLARRGTTFPIVRSAIPITGPSHASLFTARYPSEHSVHNNAQRLDERFATLAERMRESGRATAGIVSLGVLQERFGFARGFQTYEDDFARRDWWRTADEVNATALPWLRAQGWTPFFLWVHYSDPHSPYTPPGLRLPEIELGVKGGPSEAFPADGRFRTFSLALAAGSNEIELVGRGAEERRFTLADARAEGPVTAMSPPEGWETVATVWGAEHSGTLPATLTLEAGGAGRAALSFRMTESLSPAEVRGRYAAEVEFTDRRIGEVLRELESTGLAERTLVVVTSDHGEGLGDHGEIGHVDQLYESQLRVPLLLARPGATPTIASEAAGLVDVMPTVLDLLSLPPERGVRGYSLAPALRGETVAPRPAISATFPPEAKAELLGVTEAGFKYVRSVATEREELYDLGEDPGETRDRLADREDAAKRLRAVAAREGSAGARPEPVGLSEEERQRLRGLGYAH